MDCRGDCDTSALIAVLLGEEGDDRILDTLDEETGFLPAPALAEFTEIASVRRRLSQLWNEKASLETGLAAIDKLVAQPAPFANATVTNKSPSSAKVALLRSLFKGRSDILPLRWENHNSARADYSRACANEWARGICAKPKVKCRQCPHQAFMETVPAECEIVR